MSGPLHSELQLVLLQLWASLLPMAVQNNKAGILSPKQSLATLVFTTPILQHLWAALKNYCQFEPFATEFAKNNTILIPKNQYCSIVIVLASLLYNALNAIDDRELYDENKPLHLYQIYLVIDHFKQLLLLLLTANPAAILTPPGPENNMYYRYYVGRVLLGVLNDLHNRWARQPFCTYQLWIAEKVPTTEPPQSLISLLRSENSEEKMIGKVLLKQMPYTLRFYDRLTYFRDAIANQKRKFNAEAQASIVLRIRRKCILQDGLTKMESFTKDMFHKRIQIQYINEFGEEEAGIDIGGLFKDFVTDLSDQIFHPAYGLFTETSDHLVYPNPSANRFYEEHELINLYVFLGRIMGKALIENITLQTQFSGFFLNFFKENRSGSSSAAGGNIFQNLATLDSELHKNLLFVKNYTGDVADLSLTFTVSDPQSNGEIELLPGGRDMDVTNQTKIRYVNSVAKYHLYDSIKLQSKAFFRGLYDMMDPSLLGIFCAPELHILISGSGLISIRDLQQNSALRGYLPTDAVVRWFWAVFEDLNEADKRLLVKFVTSCERPPSLGFVDLNPVFTIQHAVDASDERLPTASTCFNLLKLPAYSTKAILKSKLLAAIRSGAGFEMS
jgi:ubiquitin-protein ligase E3 C